MGHAPVMTMLHVLYNTSLLIKTSPPKAQSILES